MKTLKTITIIALLGALAYGQGAGGTIPFVYSLDLTYGAGNATALASLTSSDYDATYKDISNFISAGDFEANDSCHIAVKIGSWTLPTAYPTAGNKKTVTSNSDYHLKLVGITAAADDLNIENSFNALVELTSSDQIMVRAKNDDGVQGDGFTADSRVDLDWDTDPVGAYSVTVTFTVTQDL